MPTGATPTSARPTNRACAHQIRRHKCRSVPQVSDRGTRVYSVREISGARYAPPLLETFATEHRPSLGRTKRYRRFFAALRAVCAGFRFRKRVTVRTESRAGGPLPFAVLASLGFVLELLIMEEQLFPGCEYEIRTTIHTLQNLVLEFHCKRRSHSPTLRSTGDPNGKDPVHNVGRRFTIPSFDTPGFGPPRSVHHVATS